MLPLSTGSLSLAEFGESILVDPPPSLLDAVVEAYREAAPALVDPDPSTLDDCGDPPGTDLPRLTVLARGGAFDAATVGFHPASRLAALVEADVLSLRVLDEPQPNAAIAGADGGCVLVEAGLDRYRIGDDSTLRDRYAPVVAAADEYRLRTPSRRRVYGAFQRRCDDALASDVTRALDVAVDAESGTADGNGATLDRSGARFRAYAIGTHHGALDHALRRASEDAGLGSPATFTQIKGRLRAAGMVEMESVPQPVGRPRERLVARGALADAQSASAVVEAVLGVVE